MPVRAVVRQGRKGRKKKEKKEEMFNRHLVRIKCAFPITVVETFHGTSLHSFLEMFNVYRKRDRVLYQLRWVAVLVQPDKHIRLV